jgi:hypothetical protein
MSPPVFTKCGKQLLKDGRDFAQAATPEAAQMILAALILFHKPRSERHG